MTSLVFCPHKNLRLERGGVLTGGCASSLGPGQRLPRAVVLAPQAPSSGDRPGPLSLQVRRVGLGPRQKWGWPSCTCGFRALPACLWEQCPHSDTGPHIQHLEQPTLLPFPACQPWRSPTPPTLLRSPACQPWRSPTPRHLGWCTGARGCGWGRPGGSSPLYCCPDRSVSLLPEEQCSAFQSWFPSSCPPRGAVQGGRGRQAGRVCGLYTARGGRAGCLLYRSARLQFCTQPLCSRHQLGRSALAGSVSFRWGS